MVWKVLLALVAIVAVFLIYASTKESQFRYERSGVINASADQIYPYISDLRKGNEWSPFMGQDPDMKLNFIGDGMSVGSVMEFAGNKSGSGKIELLKLNPNQGADYKLTMIKPFFAENLVEYRLTPEGTGTRFQWIMSGDGGFIGKVIATLIDCDKMIGKDFEKGIANLKQKVESQNTVVK